jgi:hypothetical protein
MQGYENGFATGREEGFPAGNLAARRHSPENEARILADRERVALLDRVVSREKIMDTLL